MSDIEKLENFKTITILYGNTFAMHTEQLKEIQEAIGNVLADLYEANNRINDLLDIVKQKDKIIDEILKTWKQDDVRSIAELKKYFEERCK